MGEDGQAVLVRFADRCSLLRAMLWLDVGICVVMGKVAVLCAALLALQCAWQSWLAKLGGLL